MLELDCLIRREVDTACEFYRCLSLSELDNSGNKLERVSIWILSYQTRHWISTFHHLLIFVSIFHMIKLGTFVVERLVHFRILLSISTSIDELRMSISQVFGYS